jgi:hypothetical protein
MHLSHSLVHGEGTDLQPQHSLPSPPSRPLICQPCCKSVPVSLSLVHGKGTDLQPQHSLPPPPTRPLICQPCCKSVPVSLSLVHGKGTDLQPQHSLPPPPTRPLICQPCGKSHVVGQYRCLFVPGRSLTFSLSFTYLCINGSSPSPSIIIERKAL